MRNQDIFPFRYFPHLFNRRENWEYDGEWPAVEYYQPQFMKSEDRERFFQWYNQQNGKRFNLQKEIEEYCISDVEVSHLIEAEEEEEDVQDFQGAY